MARHKNKKKDKKIKHRKHYNLRQGSQHRGVRGASAAVVEEPEIETTVTLQDNSDKTVELPENEKLPAIPAPTSSSSWWSSKKDKKLVLAPLAWMKLLFLTNYADTEIAGYGISSEDNPLYIEDFAIVKQTASSASFEFDDIGLADHFEDYAEQGIAPNRCGRLWIHTHPGESASPSSTDEKTFSEKFDKCDWCAMIIFGRGDGERYCRLKFNSGPGVSVILPVSLDIESYPAFICANLHQLGALHASWYNELVTKVVEERYTYTTGYTTGSYNKIGGSGYMASGYGHGPSYQMNDHRRFREEGGKTIVGRGTLFGSDELTDEEKEAIMDRAAAAAGNSGATDGSTDSSEDNAQDEQAADAAAAAAELSERSGGIGHHFVD